jgi:hypothetical protein
MHFCNFGDDEKQEDSDPLEVRVILRLLWIGIHPIVNSGMR